MLGTLIPLLKVHMPETASEALRPVLASGYLADGAQVRQFEETLSAAIGNPHVTAMSDVSGAITLALFMAGVRPGDEVIAPPMCCTATTMPMANLFARAVWCDVDPLTGMLDPNRIAALITPRTRAVLGYHWAGDVAAIEQVVAVAHAHGLKTIDDASDGFGAECRGRRLGNQGSDFTAYSFHAAKHITTGEGAALFFASPADAERAQWLKRYGIHQPSFRLPDGDLNEQSDIPVAGYNFYMNNLAATIGIEQMSHADRLVARHRANGLFYEEALDEIPGVTQLTRRRDAVSAYWAYTILVERRSDLIRKLREQGITSQRLHLRNDRYTCFDPAGRPPLPGVDVFDRKALSLPCGWWVADADREQIASVIREGW